MPFSPQQKKLLENLFSHAEVRNIHTPEYAQHCFEHVLGIYLEFGSYAIFDRLIDAYCESKVEQFHRFSSTMLTLGLECDDFRLPELVQVMAMELRGAPTGKLSEVIGAQSGVPIPIKPPRLLDVRDVLRFKISDYLQVYRVPIIRDVENTMLNPRAWSEAASMLKTIRDQDPDQGEILADALMPACFKTPFKSSDALRVAIAGLVVSGDELSQRLMAVLSSIAKALLAESESHLIPALIEMVDAYKQQGGDPACFDRVNFTKYCTVNQMEAPNLNGLLDAFVSLDAQFQHYELGFRHILVRELMAVTASNSAILLFRYGSKATGSSAWTGVVDDSEPKNSMQRMLENTILYCQGANALPDNFKSEESMFRALCAIYPVSEGVSWHELLVKKLIGTVSPEVRNACLLIDLEALGCYRLTGDSRHLNGVKDKRLLDHSLSHDLGL